MGNSSSSRRRQQQASQNTNVTYAQPNVNFAPYAGAPPPFVTPPQTIPPPGGFPPQYNQYPAHYMNNGQYYQQNWSNAPPGAQPAPVPPAPVQAPAPKPQKDGQDFTQTATIRNSVNVKKDTIKLEPVEGDPTKLRISFSFDCTQPCCVTTYVCSHEDAETFKLTPRYQTPAACCIYEKGLAHKFPKPGVTDHIVDLTRHNAAELAGDGLPPDTYPLVIRLESISEEGQLAGHTLDEFVPGQEQRSWMQSQSTYAKIIASDDEHEVRVTEQKIRIKGVTYKLQEIYGMGPAGVKADPKADLNDEERLCVICLSNIRDTTVLPCRHMCMCKDCAQELAKQTSKCPICRNTVESLLHIKVQRRGRRNSSKKSAENKGDGKEEGVERQRSGRSGSAQAAAS